MSETSQAQASSGLLDRVDDGAGPTASRDDNSVDGRRLSEADAVDIWIARWHRVPRKQILRRYGCDPRRLYEIWEGTRFLSSRDKALERFHSLYPQLVGQTDFSPHRRIPLKPPSADQLALFD